jgi:hypothetical protein
MRLNNCDSHRNHTNNRITITSRITMINLPSIMITISTTLMMFDAVIYCSDQFGCRSHHYRYSIVVTTVTLASSLQSVVDLSTIMILHHPIIMPVRILMMRHMTFKMICPILITRMMTLTYHGHTIQRLPQFHQRAMRY